MHSESASGMKPEMLSSRKHVNWKQVMTSVHAQVNRFHNSIITNSVAAAMAITARLYAFVRHSPSLLHPIPVEIGERALAFLHPESLPLPFSIPNALLLTFGFASFSFH